MKKFEYFLFFSIFISFILASCAKPGSLSGGDKDSIPPYLVRSYPVLGDTSFSDDKILLRFDEFFKLENINDEFVASPPFEEIPDFKIRKKNLIIKLKEPLKDSTTYTFYFGKAIVDYHEANPIYNFRFYFSTYNVLDSFRIAGKVIDAYTHTPDLSMYVMLYKTIDDSVVFKQMPDFLTKCDSSGHFSIENIPPGKYKIFALFDIDKNYKYTPGNEKIAFSNQLFSPEITVDTLIDSVTAGTIIHDAATGDIIDTLQNDTVYIRYKTIFKPDNILLYSFNEYVYTQYVKEYARERREKVSFKFNEKINDSISVNILEYSPEDFFVEKDVLDTTINFWIADTSVSNKDTLFFEVKYYTPDSNKIMQQLVDTFKMIYKQPENKKNIPHGQNLDMDISLSGRISPKDKIIISLSSPIISVDTAFIHLYMLKDSVVYDERKQEIIKAQREQPDLIYIQFARPLVNNLKVMPLNFKNDSVPFIVEKLPENEYKITLRDHDVIQQDTLILMLDYDNQFYNNEIQVFRDTLILNIASQKILAYKRTSQDSIKIKFKKRVIEKPFKINALNFSPNKDWYEFIYDKDSALILLKDKNVIGIDTLVMSLEMTDYYDIKNKKQVFQDTISPIFYHDKDTAAAKTDLKKQKHVKLHYDLAYTLMPDTQMVRTYNMSYNWNDTITYELFIDSLAFKDMFGQGNRVFRQKFEINGKDHFGKLSINLMNISKLEDYSSLVIPLVKDLDSNNTKKDILINDTILIDKGIGKQQKDTIIMQKDSITLQKDTCTNYVVPHTSLSQGIAIIQILDEKGEKVIRTAKTDKDSVIFFDVMEPEKVLIRIIHDKNNNGIWDTGDYLKNKYPEKVFFYGKNVEIKSKFETKVDWNLADSRQIFRKFEDPKKKKNKRKK